jgi:hypothetical protein
MADMNSLNFDEKNPAKTLAALAKIDEPQAEKFLSELPLTDYVAVVNAIEDKDLRRLSDIVGKHKLAEKKYNEAMDSRVANELKKIGQNSPQQAVIANPGNASNSNIQGSHEASASQTVANSVQGNATQPVTSTGTYSSTGPGTIPGAIAAAAKTNTTVVDANAKTGTVAVQNPQTKKVEIKSVKNPKQSPEIMALIKNAGI